MLIAQIRHYIQHHGGLMFFAGFMAGAIVLAISMTIARALVIG